MLSVMENEGEGEATQEDLARICIRRKELLSMALEAFAQPLQDVREAIVKLRQVENPDAFVPACHICDRRLPMHT
jgi:hypothetical protein